MDKDAVVVIPKSREGGRVVICRRCSRRDGIRHHLVDGDGVHGQDAEGARLIGHVVVLLLRFARDRDLVFPFRLARFTGQGEGQLRNALPCPRIGPGVYAGVLTASFNNDGCDILVAARQAGGCDGQIGIVRRRIAVELRHVVGLDRQCRAGNGQRAWLEGEDIVTLCRLRAGRRDGIIARVLAGFAADREGQQLRIVDRVGIGPDTRLRVKRGGQLAVRVVTLQTAERHLPFGVRRAVGLVSALGRNGDRRAGDGKGAFFEIHIVVALRVIGLALFVCLVLTLHGGCDGIGTHGLARLACNTVCDGALRVVVF